MTEATITQYIADTFENTYVVESGGNKFFFYAALIGEQNNFPFITLVVSDEYDQFSDLNRPEVFRLNIGVSKATFKSLFGDDSKTKEYDFTALDKLMPHPVYGNMYWLCVLNPADNTVEIVKTLLAEAYEADKQKQETRAAASSKPSTA